MSDVVPPVSVEPKYRKGPATTDYVVPESILPSESGPSEVHEKVGAVMDYVFQFTDYKYHIWQGYMLINQSAPESVDEQSADEQSIINSLKDVFKASGIISKVDVSTEAAGKNVTDQFPSSYVITFSTSEEAYDTMLDGHAYIYEGILSVSNNYAVESGSMKMWLVLADKSVEEFPTEMRTPNTDLDKAMADGIAQFFAMSAGISDEKKMYRIEENEEGEHLRYTEEVNPVQRHAPTSLRNAYSYEVYDGVGNLLYESSRWDRIEDWAKNSNINLLQLAGESGYEMFTEGGKQIHVYRFYTEPYSKTAIVPVDETPKPMTVVPDKPRTEEDSLQLKSKVCPESDCGFSTDDIVELMSHIDTEHGEPSMYVPDKDSLDDYRGKPRVEEDAVKPVVSPTPPMASTPASQFVCPYPHEPTYTTDNYDEMDRHLQSEHAEPSLFVPDKDSIDDYRGKPRVEEDEELTPEEAMWDSAWIDVCEKKYQPQDKCICGYHRDSGADAKPTEEDKKLIETIANENTKLHVRDVSRGGIEDHILVEDEEAKEKCSCGSELVTDQEGASTCVDCGKLSGLCDCELLEDGEMNYREKNELTLLDELAKWLDEEEECYGEDDESYKEVYEDDRAEKLGEHHRGAPNVPQEARPNTQNPPPEKKREERSISSKDNNWS